MTENELYELNQLPEIDPDYERKKTEAAQAEENIKFRTLFLPVLSILISAWFIVPCLSGAQPPIFITLFGLIGGGIVPTVLIVRNRIDTSKYFLDKMILFVAQVVAAVFVFLGEFFGVLLMIVTVIAELALALFPKTDRKTKLCLILSSCVWCFIGFFIDFILVLFFFV